MKSMICMTKVVRELTKEQSCILAHKSMGKEPSNPHRLHQLGSPSEFCSIYKVETSKFKFVRGILQNLCFTH
jgi:hypothetical protein